jgi:hypothetical protein
MNGNLRMSLQGPSLVKPLGCDANSILEMMRSFEINRVED